MIDPTQLSTLECILPGDALERIQDMFADPGRIPHKLARLGAALSVGDQLTSAAHV